MSPFSARLHTVIACIISLPILLSGCGGGDMADDATAASSAPGTNASAALAGLALKAPVALPAPTYVLSGGLVAVAAAGSSTAESGATSAPANSMQVSSMSTLSDASTDSRRTSDGLGPVAGCRLGYTPPTFTSQDEPSKLPPSGGVFYGAAELATWKARVTSGPFLSSNDFTNGSPGDWDRIVANSKLMRQQGESRLSAATPASDRATHGTLARDAAFHALVTGDASSAAAAKAYLLEQARNPSNEFAGLCITTTEGTTYDAWFFHAAWLLRALVTYDYVRPQFESAERVVIENWFRRSAYFLAAHTDWGVGQLFPQRHLGDYSFRASVAAEPNENARYWTKRYDADGNCEINSADTQALPVYAYVDNNGRLGPRITVVSQYYNNRKSTSAIAFGAAGLMLGDSQLVDSAKRYFMEWLAYGVWPDGSQGEYARNGDYCIAAQGPIYAASNLQAAGLLARLLDRQGDRSLVNFSTSAGLFGTESSAGQPAKSLEAATATYLHLIAGELKWYFHQPWRTSQNLTASGSLGNTEVHYMGNARAMDDYHELGLIHFASLLPKAGIAGIVLRDKSMTSLRFPGSTGNPVPTGYGNWTDAFNALPAALFLRP